MRFWVSLGMDSAAGARLRTSDTAAGDRPTWCATSLSVTFLRGARAVFQERFGFTVPGKLASY